MKTINPNFLEKGFNTKYSTRIVKLKNKYSRKVKHIKKKNE